MSKDLIIVGAGGHARSIVDLVESQGEYKIRGLLDSSRPAGDKVYDYKVLGSLADLGSLLALFTCEIVIAIGDNFQRQKVNLEISSKFPNLRHATLIHSTAYVSKRAVLGEGTVVMASAIVNAGCKIGNGVVLNSGTIVEHDACIENFASLATHASIGGGVRIGERSFIGLGAKLVHNINVAQDVYVGAGSVLLKSVEANSVICVGVPAKVVRARRPDEQHL